MADIETRVALLEKDLAALKARVEVHDAELINIPELIKVEFRFVNSRFSRIDQELGDLREQSVANAGRVGKLSERLDRLSEEFERFPRVMAEVVNEVVRDVVKGAVKEAFDERDRRSR